MIILGYEVLYFQTVLEGQTREEDKLLGTPFPYWLPHTLFPLEQLCFCLLYILCIHFLWDNWAKWIFGGRWSRFQKYKLRKKMTSSHALARIGSGFRVSAPSGLVWWGRYIIPFQKSRVHRGKRGREVGSVINVDSFALGPSLYNLMMTSNMEEFQIIW